MPDNLFDPNFDTSTVAELTTQTRSAAKEGWSRIELEAGKRHGPYYRVNVGPWDPTRENPLGRWAGIEKPANKIEAHKMYALNWHDLAQPWILTTFYIEPTSPAWIFQSSVNSGTSRQIKLPNPVCKFVRVEKTEELEAS